MVVHESNKVARARRRIRGGVDGTELACVKDVLCEPARLGIVEALGGEELSVGDLAAAIGRKVPATSQHLRVLRELGLVERQRRARAVYYRLRPGSASEQVLRVLGDLRGGNDARG